MLKYFQKICTLHLSKRMMTNIWDEGGPIEWGTSCTVVACMFACVKIHHILLFFCGSLQFATHFLSAWKLWVWWQCCFVISVQSDRHAGCNNFKITWFGYTNLQASRGARFNVFGSVKKRRRRIRSAEEGGSKEKNRGWLERMYS